MHAFTGRPRSFSMPSPIRESELLELGAWRGAHWFHHLKHGDLREGPTIDSRGILPAGPVLEVDDGDDRYWRTFEAFDSGTFERLASDTDRPPRPAPVQRPIPTLRATHLGRRQPERVFAGKPTAPIGPLGRGAPMDIKSPQPDVQGAASVIDRLRAKGAEVHKSASGEHLVLTARDGRPAPGVVELFERSMPLIHALVIGGTPLTCAAGVHAEPVEATEILIGGCPACPEHSTFVETGDPA